MKTKFSPLVKLKQQLIDSIRNEIAQVSKDIFKQKEKILLHKTSFLTQEMPKSGSIDFFYQHQLLKNAFKKELAFLENVLQNLINKEKELKNRLKNEYIEFEKFNYLHNDEIKKILKTKKEKESKFLDEIGTMRFYTNSKDLRD